MKVEYKKCKYIFLEKVGHVKMYSLQGIINEGLYERKKKAYKRSKISKTCLQNTTVIL